MLCVLFRGSDTAWFCFQVLQKEQEIRNCGGKMTNFTESISQIEALRREAEMYRQYRINVMEMIYRLIRDTFNANCAAGSRIDG